MAFDGSFLKNTEKQKQCMFYFKRSGRATPYRLCNKVRQAVLHPRVPTKAPCSVIRRYLTKNCETLVRRAPVACFLCLPTLAALTVFFFKCIRSVSAPNPNALPQEAHACGMPEAQSGHAADTAAINSIAKTPRLRMTGMSWCVFRTECPHHQYKLMHLTC